MQQKTKQQIDQVKACLRHLSGVCDGASSKDGHGFDGRDAGSQFIKDAVLWANGSGRNMSFKAVLLLLKTCKKYHRQLSKAGLVVPDRIEELEQIVAGDATGSSEASSSPRVTEQRLEPPAPEPQMPGPRFETPAPIQRRTPVPQPVEARFSLSSGPPDDDVPHPADDGFYDQIAPASYATEPDPVAAAIVWEVPQAQRPEARPTAWGQRAIGNGAQQGQVVGQQRTLAQQTEVEFIGQIFSIRFGPGENGFTICSMAVQKVLHGEEQMLGYPQVTVAGRIPTAKAGATYKVGGNWEDARNKTTNRSYGRQIKASMVIEQIPETRGGLISWLTTIPGIGPVLAARIVDHFGPGECVDVLTNGPERIAEIEGIGVERTTEMIRKITERGKHRELIMWLGSLGLSHTMIEKIRLHFEELEVDPMQAITDNPYCLMELDGIGFKKADTIALALQIPPDAPFRIAAGVLHGLDARCSEKGHCYIPREELVSAAFDVFKTMDGRAVREVSRAQIAETIEALVNQGRIAEEGGGVWPVKLHSAENEVAAAVIARLKKSKLDGLDPAAIEQWQSLTGLRLHEVQEEAVALALTERAMVLTGGPGTGKGLALDTPIATPAGWKLMGELQVGDRVFDERGEPCRVTFVSETHHRPCFRMEFDDGSTLIADDQHRWLTTTRAARKSEGRRRAGPVQRRGSDQSAKRVLPAVVSTLDIRDTLQVGKEQRFNHAIAMPAPFVTPAARLPLDPYVLGVWLGNGDTAGASITDGDRWIRSELERIGYPTSDRVDKRAEETGGKAHRYGIFDRNGSSLLPVLRGLGVLGNKHIPDIYLFARADQRMALLQGLMDTDGHCGDRHRCEFSVTHKPLADGVYKLICGLGIKAYRDERPAMLNGKECGTAYRVSFTTDLPVMRYPRKRMNLPVRVRPTTRRRYIVGVVPIESVPTRCIQVDSPSHLFLAGEACIPTHNTTTTRAIVDLLERSGRRVALVAPTGKASRRLSNATGREAQTIHRLIGLSRDVEGNRRQDGLYIDANTVLVDESSMVDIQLMRNLVRVMHPECQLIMVGDIDQLPSVGPGSVLRDMIESDVVPKVRLTQIFRQAGGMQNQIVAAAHDINHGVVPTLKRYEGKDSIEPSTMLWLDVPKGAPEEATEAVVRVMYDLQEWLVDQGKTDDPFEISHVLIPQRSGACGVKDVNIRLQAEFNTSGIPIKDGHPLKVGDKVMQIRNNYELDMGRGVFNGDVGYIVQAQPRDGVVVISYEGKPVTYTYSQVDDVVASYASTVHKFQGSELPVIIAICHNSHQYMLCRQLLYTAVTRGKQTVIVIGDQRAIEKAVADATIAQRYTMLKLRLRRGLQRIEPARQLELEGDPFGGDPYDDEQLSDYGAF